MVRIPRPRHKRKETEAVLRRLETAGWSIVYPSGHWGVPIAAEAAGSGSGIEDAVPSSINGVVKVTAPIPADDDHAAALRLIDFIQAALPQAIPVRLDQDLVSITDIAERSDRTRESIRLFVEAKRGPGHFPPPIGIVGNAIRVWPWSSVLDWFREALGEEPDERGVSPDTAAAIDTYLAEKRRHAVA